jgi:hypothetical protein
MEKTLGLTVKPRGFGVSSRVRGGRGELLGSVGGLPPPLGPSTTTRPHKPRTSHAQATHEPRTRGAQAAHTARHPQSPPPRPFLSSPSGPVAAPLAPGPPPPTGADDWPGPRPLPASLCKLCEEFMMAAGPWTNRRPRPGGHVRGWRGAARAPPRGHHPKPRLRGPRHRCHCCPRRRCRGQPLTRIDPHPRRPHPPPPGRHLIDPRPEDYPRQGQGLLLGGVLLFPRGVAITG